MLGMAVTSLKYQNSFYRSFFFLPLGQSFATSQLMTFGARNLSVLGPVLNIGLCLAASLTQVLPNVPVMGKTASIENLLKIIQSQGSVDFHLFSFLSCRQQPVLHIEGAQCQGGLNSHSHGSILIEGLCVLK